MVDYRVIKIYVRKRVLKDIGGSICDIEADFYDFFRNRYGVDPMED